MGTPERWMYCREEGNPGRKGSAMGPGEPLSRRKAQVVVSKGRSLLLPPHIFPRSYSREAAGPGDELKSPIPQSRIPDTALGLLLREPFGFS